MIYLNEDTVRFLYPYIIDIKRTHREIIPLIESSNPEETLQLRLISQTTASVKFALKIPHIFSLSLMTRQDTMLVYTYHDGEHCPHRQFVSITELNRLKGSVKVQNFHFILSMFTQAIVNTLEAKEKGEYQDQFSYHSFRTIRFLCMLFIADCNIVYLWGSHHLRLLKHAVQFEVIAHHFTGHVKIAYNQGSDLFDVSFLQKETLSGQRKGISFDELIDYIDKKIEYIPAYQNR